MFIRRRSGGRKGCDPVEMYFDPGGKESVVDCILQEGYHVARREDLDVCQGGVACRGDLDTRCGGGMGTEQTNAMDNGFGSGNGTGEWSAPEFDVSSSVLRGSGRGPMSMVTSALAMLEMTDSA